MPFTAPILFGSGFTKTAVFETTGNFGSGSIDAYPDSITITSDPQSFVSVSQATESGVDQLDIATTGSYILQGDGGYYRNNVPVDDEFFYVWAFTSWDPGSSGGAPLFYSVGSERSTSGANVNYDARPGFIFIKFEETYWTLDPNDLEGNRRSYYYKNPQGTILPGGNFSDANRVGFTFFTDSEYAVTGSTVWTLGKLD